jgi:alpha-tubulin suppressor-like RCC1 family protein
MKTSQLWSLASAFLLVLPLESDAKPAGVVIGWGENFLGETTGIPSGDNSTTGVVMVAGQTLTNITAVCAGEAFSLGLASDGTVFGWGGNVVGAAIGITNGYPCSASGQVIIGGKPLSNVVGLAAGRTHSIALKNDGTVATWGGIGAGKPSVPLDLSNIMAVAAGADGSLVLKNNGTVSGWDMQLPSRFKKTGEDLEDQVSQGLTNIVAIAAAPEYFWKNYALAKDGTVKEWHNQHGATLDSVAGLSNVVAIAAGPNYALALKSNGTVAAWGQESGATSIPTDLTNVIAIATSGCSLPAESYALALKNDGTVVAWGRMNSHPATVPDGISNVVAIAAGGGWCLAITTNSAVAEKFQQK